MVYQGRGASLIRTHYEGTNKGRFSIRGFTAVLNLQLEHSCIIVACMLTITTRRARAARAARGAHARGARASPRARLYANLANLASTHSLRPTAAQRRRPERTRRRWYTGRPALCTLRIDRVLLFVFRLGREGNHRILYITARLCCMSVYICRIAAGRPFFFPLSLSRH